MMCTPKGNARLDENTVLLCMLRLVALLVDMLASGYCLDENTAPSAAFRSFKLI